MSGRYLLDSNIVIAIFAGEEAVLTSVDRADEVFVPCIVIGELYYGAQKSGKRQINIARIDSFAEINAVIDCNHETARWYGQVKHQLLTKGRPIPENDIWIAALAFQYKLSLVTRDKHFLEIDSLDLVEW